MLPVPAHQTAATRVSPAVVADGENTQVVPEVEPQLELAGATVCTTVMLAHAGQTSRNERRHERMRFMINLPVRSAASGP
jgi:hypothetical protein